jgi:hypothetical protein
MVIREERRFCTPEKLKKLRDLGYSIEGYDREMEKILKAKGFGLPTSDDNGDSYGFIVNYKYIRICLNRADCLAEEIILLHELNLL